MARKKRDITQKDGFDVDSLLFYKEAVSRYPYCAVARLNFLLNLKVLGDPTYEHELPFTALSLPDRKILKAHVARLDLPSKEEHEVRTMGSAEETSLLPQKANVSSDVRFDPFKEVFISSETISDLLKKEFVSEFVDEKIAGKETASRKTADKSVVEHKNTAKRSNKKIGAISTEQTIIEKVEENVSEKLAKEVGCEAKAALDPNQLIERFLRHKPEDLLIKVDNQRNYDNVDPDPDKASLSEDPQEGSETLALLYLKQGYTGKAIAIYKHLSLKFPEKSRYFAGLIRKAKKETIKK